MTDAEEATKTTPEAMETSTKEVKDVKVEMMSPTMPMIPKLAHALAVVVAGVIALAVSSVLADGTSVIRLKDPQYLPIATDPSLKSAGISHRLDQLLGPTYGIGLHHDQSGHSWTSISAGSTLKDLVSQLGVPVVVAALPNAIANDDLKHPVPFLSCDALQMAGLCAMSFGFIAETVAAVMVIFHTLVLVGIVPGNIIKPFAALVWVTLTAGFMIVILLACGIYTATWECDNPVIPSIKISDHFHYNYGFAYAIIGFLSSLLIFVVMLSATSMKPMAAPAGLASIVTKVLGGVVVGVVVCVVASMIVLGGTDAFTEVEADPDVNPCEGMKPYSSGPGDKYFANVDCLKDEVVQTLEQAGANVTKGYVGGLETHGRNPITTNYDEAGLCPVNVHWHLGAEHLSVGQYDEYGSGPCDSYGHRRELGDDSCSRRKLAGDTVRLGGQCHHYDASDSKFTTEYDWKHCTKMEVGQTYEIHWPHSAAGSCGTDWQYQSPFYDGVFCNAGLITILPLNTFEKIGVQGQIFTVVNDESYYYDNLIAGAWMDDSHWADVAMYTGSTTGTSRDNDVCSRYTPITWQVDRTCHMISASSFDKLCQDMSGMKDDMSMDYYPHGARAVSSTAYVADNLMTQSRK
jgi:hypothetical protein